MPTLASIVLLALCTVHASAARSEISVVVKTNWPGHRQAFLPSSRILIFSNCLTIFPPWANHIPRLTTPISPKPCIEYFFLKTSAVRPRVSHATGRPQVGLRHLSHRYRSVLLVCGSRSSSLFPTCQVRARSRLRSPAPSAVVRYTGTTKLTERTARCMITLSDEQVTAALSPTS